MALPSRARAEGACPYLAMPWFAGDGPRFTRRQRLHVRLSEGLRWEVAEPPAPVLEAREQIIGELRGSGGGMTAAELARATGLAEKTAQNQLTSLIGSGEVERSGAGHRWNPCRYRLQRASNADKPFPPCVVESIRSCKECGGNL
jgi:hypothetical protein